MAKSHPLPPAASTIYCYSDKATPEEVGQKFPPCSITGVSSFPAYGGHHEGHPFLHLTDVFALRWYLSLSLQGIMIEGNKNTLVYISKIYIHFTIISES